MKKLLDFKKLVLRVWLILWAILLILLIMKFCFGIWYPIVVENEHLVKLFNWLDEHTIVKNIIYYTIYIINGTLMIMIFTKTKRFKYWWLYLISIIVHICMVIIKNKINALGVIFEILIVICSIIYNIKFKKFSKKIIFNVLPPIIIYLLINIWQLNILLIRGLNIETIQTLPSLLSLVLQLDYYIFLIITYIGVCQMGILGYGWLWNKDITELKALREKELLKSKPNQKLLAEIDRVIKSKEEMGE